MKKLLSILALCALCVCANADAYRDALVRYLQVDNTMDREQYEKKIKPIFTRLYPGSEDKTYAIMEEYMTSQMMNDMVDIFEPAFRKHVSEADLNDLIAIYSDPRYKEINRRSSNISENLATSEEYINFAKRFQTAAIAISNGQEVPEDNYQPADVPGDYAQAFMQYYKDSKLDETMMAMFRSIGNMLAESMRKEGKPDADKKIEAIMNYAADNLPLIMMSVYHKAAITKDDLQYMTAVSTKPSSIRSIEALQEILVNPVQFAADMLKKLTNWMDAHHPDYAGQLHKTVDELEKMQQQ